MYLVYYLGGDLTQLLLIIGALAITGLSSLYIRSNYKKYKEN